MKHKKSLEKLHQQSLAQIDAYIKTQKHLKNEHHEKIAEAKKKWQSSWSEFMDMLMYLETLEI